MSSPFVSTRSAVLTWAGRACPDHLREAADIFLGKSERTRENALSAATFAVLAPPADGPALYELYAAANPQLPRAQREALAAWAGARFGLYEVLEVKPDRGFQLRDVLTEATQFVQERKATKHITVGEWLVGTVVPIDGHLELEGTLARVLPEAREAAVEAAKTALASAGVEPAAATPADTLRLARPVCRALNVAAGIA
jgi:hypothetical protein